MVSAGCADGGVIDGPNWWDELVIVHYTLEQSRTQQPNWREGVSYHKSTYQKDEHNSTATTHP